MFELPERTRLATRVRNSLGAIVQVVRSWADGGVVGVDRWGGDDQPAPAWDSARLVAGRDAEFHRFLGPGADEPDPVVCVSVDGDVVGWVDHDAERSWLLDGEVNVGYNVFASHRGRGIASRAVQLLMHHLAVTGHCRTATLLIDRANGVLSRSPTEPGSFAKADLDGNPYYKRAVPPITYRQGGVAIRRRDRHDLDMDLSGRDDEHIGWLWAPSEAEQWEVMEASERRARCTDVVGGCERLLRRRASMGVLDRRRRMRRALEGSTSTWPATMRRRAKRTSHTGCTPSSEVTESCPLPVRLALQFLRDHTGARRVHIMVDPDNRPSLAVAASTGGHRRSH